MSQKSRSSAIPAWLAAWHLTHGHASGGRLPGDCRHPRGAWQVAARDRQTSSAVGREPLRRD
ncbi:hypothetical protein WOLCODRAFT_158755 [Wolfiporia cocos MD-104 SS10]|uniref:Uncharacterized protein n=1 Tax=Wolfiporia cocos (strain MD-104) TaxID=742152 RepID=A0A2H3JAF4_WOLCO|nr:hypothetical protein WOLCODRAFT_158755 [Wolfiporia cocos MD-104 SS10]